MDKIFFLVKQLYEALFDSQLHLDEQDLFESMRGADLDEVFDETNTEWNDELLR